MNCSEDNIKTDFNAIYCKPTPHAYLSAMMAHNYQLADKIHPYIKAAAVLLQANNHLTVNMLDIGCSYGIGTLLIKYGMPFKQIAHFYMNHAQDFESCRRATKKWLDHRQPEFDMRCIGIDSAREAVSFGLKAGLLDGGIIDNFEVSARDMNKGEIQWLASSNLLISIGVVGYITEKTFDIILKNFGENNLSPNGPYAIFSILRMFDIESIINVFHHYGFNCKSVPGVLLKQRCFGDTNEQTKIVTVLNNKGIDTSEKEDKGSLYADLYIAAPHDRFSTLHSAIIEAGIVNR